MSIFHGKIAMRDGIAAIEDLLGELSRLSQPTGMEPLLRDDPLSDQTRARLTSMLSHLKETSCDLWRELTRANRTTHCPYKAG